LERDVLLFERNTRCFSYIVDCRPRKHSDVDHNHGRSSPLATRRIVAGQSFSTETKQKPKRGLKFPRRSQISIRHCHGPRAPRGLEKSRHERGRVVTHTATPRAAIDWSIREEQAHGSLAASRSMPTRVSTAEQYYTMGDDDLKFPNPLTLRSGGVRCTSTQLFITDILLYPWRSSCPPLKRRADHAKWRHLSYKNQRPPGHPRPDR
jgi:hypothetical protein